MSLNLSLFSSLCLYHLLYCRHHRPFSPFQLFLLCLLSPLLLVFPSPSTLTITLPITVSVYRHHHCPPSLSLSPPTVTATVTVAVAVQCHGCREWIEMGGKIGCCCTISSSSPTVTIVIHPLSVSANSSSPSLLPFTAPFAVLCRCCTVADRPLLLVFTRRRLSLSLPPFTVTNLLFPFPLPSPSLSVVIHSYIHCSVIWSYTLLLELRFNCCSAVYHSRYAFHNCSF